MWPQSSHSARRLTARVALRAREGFRRGARRFTAFLFLLAIVVAPFFAVTLRATGFLAAVFRTVRRFAGRLRAGRLRVAVFFFVRRFALRRAFNKRISLISCFNSFLSKRSLERSVSNVPPYKRARFTIGGRSSSSTTQTFDEIKSLYVVPRSSGIMAHLDVVAVRFIAERTTCKRSNPFHGHPPTAPPAPLEMFVL